MITKSTMSRNVIALLIILLVSRPGWATASDEPSEMLARAEALYYEADFSKSVELLLRADELLQAQSERLTKHPQLHHVDPPLPALALGYKRLSFAEPFCELDLGQAGPLARSFQRLEENGVPG